VGQAGYVFRAGRGLARGPHLKPECRTDTSNLGGKRIMYLQPVVRCKNPDCPTPSAVRIRLPYPNPPKTGDATPDWPQQEWKLRLICRDCDHWYIYEKNDVQWAPYTHPLAEQANLDFWRTELECGEANCGSHTHWHVLDNSQMSEIEMLEFVLRADPVVVCENDHPLSISGTAAKSAKKVASL